MELPLFLLIIPPRGSYFWMWEKSFLNLITFHLINNHHFPHPIGSHCLITTEGIHCAFLPLLNGDEKCDEARPWGWHGLGWFMPICTSSYCHITHYNHTASGNRLPDGYLPHRFRCSGIQEQFSWWLRLRVFHEFAVKVSASCSHLKAGSGLGGLLPMCTTHSHGCWQANSVPPLMGLFIGLLKCPYDLWLPSEQVIQEKTGSKPHCLWPMLRSHCHPSHSSH